MRVGDAVLDAVGHRSGDDGQPVGQDRGQTLLEIEPGDEGGTGSVAEGGGGRRIRRRLDRDVGELLRVEHDVVDPQRRHRQEREDDEQNRRDGRGGPTSGDPSHVGPP